MDRRHFPHGLVQHRSEAGVEDDAHDFLRLAERVAEQHRHRARVERLTAERHDACCDFRSRRHAVARQAERRLHHERVRAAPLARLGSEAVRELEIAGVEQRAGVKATGLGYFRVRSPLLTESRFLYFPAVTEMFHFAAFAQEFRDQRLFDSYPELIAAFHAYQSRLVPRHPPYALNCLTTFIFGFPRFASRPPFKLIHLGRSRPMFGAH